ncbi:RsmF rRNA methyltransferase first C-terminal domain-containing protein [Paenibacillus aurantius]|uniref:RsmF rRNA methyltransferase first C-terminal domain-containing protein n=1 Tax=Paenibacillus aurantius TaxID=2918900 RepID=A0AA96L9W6_9BACL|nr:RsmF rRNA methyltransferase first C-terminal domain-containing protein [Paenibacillus aurantius]WNQ09711.1 RsmF rRNA methyltransferase first C-terminal domain-containing protein [Paenibacillus aurantius]
MTQLPESYLDQMRSLLGPETDAFLASYQDPRTQGLRFNPLRRAVPDSVRERLVMEWRLIPVPWCPSGYYYPEEIRPGKHPFHAGGLYYIQEPSAMSAVEVLDPKPGEIVLDLAAAPGGKSTQIAGKLGGEGLLVANEIHPARAKILSENIERMGAANAVVVSASPDRLASRFPLFFDKIMLDAPCSGEGMFRKDPAAIGEWSPDHVVMCAARQRDILREAVKMLKPGGELAYSTCTFNRQENEETMDAMLEEFPELERVRTERLWPHKGEGEGHFVCLLRKDRDAVTEAAAGPDRKTRKGASAAGKRPKGTADAWELFSRLREEAFPGLKLRQGEPLLFGDQLYWLPQAESSPFQAHWLDGLKVLRPGLHLAEIKKGRAEPAHALAMAMEPAEAGHSFRLDPEGEEAAAYLRGEALPSPDSIRGWCLVTAEGCPLGWGKASGGWIKNHYPKGLRLP